MDLQRLIMEAWQGQPEKRGDIAKAVLLSAASMLVELSEALPPHKRISREAARAAHTCRMASTFVQNPTVLRPPSLILPGR